MIGAAKNPFLRRSYQSGFYGIIFKVVYRFTEMFFVADEAVEILGLPKITRAFEQAIGSFPGVGFPAM
jgi:hypothetical protein